MWYSINLVQRIFAAAGVSISMNAQQRRAPVDQQTEYDKLDNIAYSELMKACRVNPKTKNLTETGSFNTALTFSIVFDRDITISMR